MIIIRRDGVSDFQLDHHTGDLAVTTDIRIIHHIILHGTVAGITDGITLITVHTGEVIILAIMIVIMAIIILITTIMIIITEVIMDIDVLWLPILQMVTL